MLVIVDLIRSQAIGQSLTERVRKIHGRRFKFSATIF